MELSPVEWDDLINMVCCSVVARYEGDVERRGCVYFPLDEHRLRNIAFELWGDYAAIEVRDAALFRLMKEGAEHWPHGWCQEDLDEEEDALASLRDQEEEEDALRCLDCGRELDEDVATRDECFACYCEHQV